MTVTRALRLAFLLATLFPAAARASEDATLDSLATWMSGSFSSGQQAQADTNFFDIRLEMVPIWTDRADGPWLYVEQAAANGLDRPYRQRVYHLRREGNTFVSEVFTLPDAGRYALAWTNPGLFDRLLPDSLTVREGCAVYLADARATDDAFLGATRGTGCESTLRGASYATSEVRVREDRIESWDRGFDADGVQIWGSEHGPYVFLKTAGPGMTPEWVLNRAMEAMGGAEQVAAVPGIEAHAACTGPNGPYTTDVYSTSDGRLRFHQTSAGGEYVAISDGERAWFVENDSLRAVAPQALAMFRAHEFQMIALQFAVRFRDPRWDGRGRFEGKDSFRLVVTDELGRSVHAWFDVETGLLAGWEFDDIGGGASRIRIVLQAWQEVDGLRLPSTVIASDADGEYRLVYEKLVVRSLPDSMFERPK
jgi:outer membrane lipoprotein-sorting protein